MGFNCVRLTWPVYLATKASIASLTVDESLRHLGLVESAEGIAVNNPQILNLTLIEAFKRRVIWAVEHDLDWAIWALQGSYYIREGQPNFDETYGVLSWDRSKPRSTNFLQRISAIQSPFQGPGLSCSSPYNVIFHPLTGLCVLQNKLNGKPALGSYAEYEAWNYTSKHNLVLKDSGLCLNAEDENNEVKFGTNCEVPSSKWDLITNSQMLLSTKTGNNGNIVCLDINLDNTIITSSCKWLVEEGPCNAESQWFKIVYSNR